MALIFHYDYKYDEVKADCHCHEKRFCIYHLFIHSSFVFDGGSETLS